MQGEQQALTHDIERYRLIFPTIVPAFRRAFGQTEMPFCIISIQGEGGAGAENAELGCANSYATVQDIHYRAHLKTPGTGFVTAHDISGGLHPNWKRPLGERAAVWALTNVYKDAGMSAVRRDFEPKVEFKGDKAVVYLMYKAQVRNEKGELIPTLLPYKVYYPKTYDQTFWRGFAIAGEDQRWYPGHVRLGSDEKYPITERDKIKRNVFNCLEIYHPLVKKPVALRYGFGDSDATMGPWFDPVPPFRTDDWPTTDYKPGRNERAGTFIRLQAARKNIWDRTIRQAAPDARNAEFLLYGDAKRILQSTVGRINAALTGLEPDEDFRAQATTLSKDCLEEVPANRRTPEELFAKYDYWWVAHHRLKDLPDEMERSLKDKRVATKLEQLRKALKEFEEAVNALPDAKPLPDDIRPNPKEGMK
jgi:hypothetical protein